MAISMIGLNTTTISGVQFLLFIVTQVARLCYILSLLNGKTITSVFQQIHIQPKPYKTHTSFEEIQIKQSKQCSTMQQATVYYSACFKLVLYGMKQSHTVNKKELKRSIIQLHLQKETSHLSPSRWLNYSTYT